MRALVSGYKLLERNACALHLWRGLQGSPPRLKNTSKCFPNCLSKCKFGHRFCCDVCSRCHVFLQSFHALQRHQIWNICYQFYGYACLGCPQNSLKPAPKTQTKTTMFLYFWGAALPAWSPGQPSQAQEHVKMPSKLPVQMEPVCTKKALREVTMCFFVNLLPKLVSSSSAE